MQCSSKQRTFRAVPLAPNEFPAFGCVRERTSRAVGTSSDRSALPVSTSLQNCYTRNPPEERKNTRHRPRNEKYVASSDSIRDVDHSPQQAPAKTTPVASSHTIPKIGAQSLTTLFIGKVGGALKLIHFSEKKLPRAWAGPRKRTKC